MGTIVYYFVVVLFVVVVVAMQNGKHLILGTKGSQESVYFCTCIASLLNYGIDLTDKLDTQFAGSNMYKDI